MQKLTDIIGRGGIVSGAGENMKAQTERVSPKREIESPPERLYHVTWIVPVEAVMIDEGRVIVRVEVVATNDHQAMYRAGVRASGE